MHLCVSFNWKYIQVERFMFSIIVIIVRHYVKRHLASNPIYRIM